MQSPKKTQSQASAKSLSVTHLERGAMIGGRFEVSQLTRNDFIGTVYSALDVQSQRDVECLLIGLLPEDTPQLLELRAHIHDVKKLKLKSFASTYGIGKQGNDGYLVRQRIEGRPLTDHLNHRSQNHRPFKQRGLCSLLIEMIQALQALEAQDVDVSSHGVIRPNIVMIQNQSKPRVRMTDLGLGSLRSALVKNRESDPWTRGCVPELRGEQRPQNPDMYALGALLFQMTQLRPFTKGWLRELSVTPTFSQLPDLIEACTAAAPLITLADLKSELKFAAQSQVESGGLTRDLSQLQERLQKIIHYEPTPSDAASEDSIAEKNYSGKETVELEDVTAQISTALSEETAQAIAAEKSVSVVFDSLPSEEEAHEQDNVEPLFLTPVPTSAYLPAENKAVERKANLLSAPAAVEPFSEDEGEEAHDMQAEREFEPILPQTSEALDESSLAVDMSAMNEMFERPAPEEESQIVKSETELDRLDYKIETLHGVELEDLDEADGDVLSEPSSSNHPSTRFDSAASLQTPPNPPAIPIVEGSRMAASPPAHGQPRRDAGISFEADHLPLIPPPAASSLPYDDDLNGQRWIVVRDGVDYGPYTLDELSHQLFREEIDLETEICDIESDERAALGEFASLEQVLNEWAKERLIRRQQKIELERRAKVRRRYTLIALIASLAVMVFAGVSYGPQLRAAMLPAPVNVNLSAWVERPSEMKVLTKLKENPSKRAERARLRRAQKARLETLRDAKAMAREAREASAATTVDFNRKGKKLKRFSRADFDEAIATRSAKLLRCIEAEHQRDPDRAVIKVTMTVQRSGRFLNARLADGTGPGVKCVFRAIQGLKMPPFSGGDKTITLPYKVK